MSTPVKYGVFWEPGPPLTDLINRWKQHVEDVEPDAVYLGHPVHMTLFVLMADNNSLEQLTNILQEICLHNFPISIETTNWHVFAKDGATGGGDTLTLGVQLSEPLFRLQQQVASGISSLRSSNLPYMVNWDGVYGESYRQWGFPFVGKHWMPHLSIASVKKEGKKVIRAALHSPEISRREQLKALSLYRIEGDEHLFIKKMYFKSLPDAH
jgi:2'-5' RNA ligase